MGGLKADHGRFGELTKPPVDRPGAIAGQRQLALQLTYER
jgi:hypothetical protein